MTKRKRGRPRGFKNRDIAQYNNNLYIVVDHRMRGTKSEYRLVPYSRGQKRTGHAIWVQSYRMLNTGAKSNTKAAVSTYRANRGLDESLPDGRGCRCECCVHEAIPRTFFDRWTGEYKDE